MTSHLKLLEQRRQRLQARCALQRDAMAIHKIRLGRSFTTFDTGMRIVDRLRDNPALLLALVGGLFLLKPRRLLPILQTGLTVSRGWRLVAPFVGKWLGAPRRRTGK